MLEENKSLETLEYKGKKTRRNPQWMMNKHWNNIYRPLFES